MFWFVCGCCDLSQITASLVCSEADAPFARTYRETAKFLSRETTKLKKKKMGGNYQKEDMTILIGYVASDG